MTSLTINLSDETLKLLKEKAELFRISPEDLIRLSLEDLLSRPDEAFQNAMKYVVSKNAELYRRLATK
ncbi:MAG: DNA-binding protein [Nitrospirae bacterium]|nr:DNA-binding protein [Nitrospirota bacterium]